MQKKQCILFENPDWKVVTAANDETTQTTSASEAIEEYISREFMNLTDQKEYGNVISIPKNFQLGDSPSQGELAENLFLMHLKVWRIKVIRLCFCLVFAILEIRVQTLMSKLSEKLT